MYGIAIQAENLGKRYSLGSRGGTQDTLRDVLTDGFRSLMLRSRDPGRDRVDFWALRAASFEIKEGENVGIIGLNGAGKSTLLKILSRITEPTAGVCRISGRVGALLEVGTGFHWELTGRENVYLYGAILGMSKAEITRKFDAIVDFSGIGEFMDTPVKRYSSGMYVRLAFAVAAHVDPDVLLLDEVLSVGDLSFQRKCMEFAQQLQRRRSTILFVSHNMFSIKTMCQRVIYLRHGQIQFDGSTEEGIKLYEEDCRLSTPCWAESEKRGAEWTIAVQEVVLYDERGCATTVFEYGERMTVRVRCKAREPVSRPNFIIAFVRSDMVQACVYSSEADGVAIGQVKGDMIIELQTPPLRLTAQAYAVHVVFREPGFQKVLGAQVGRTFHVRHHVYDMHFGLFHEAGEWSWECKEGDRSGRVTNEKPVKARSGGAT